MKKEQLSKSGVFCALQASMISIFFFLVTCAEPSKPVNNPPIILSLTPTKVAVNFLESITIKADVKDAEGDSISFLWNSDKGNFTFTSLDSAIWNAPDTSGSVMITLSVNDQSGQDVESTIISVHNQGPIITALTASETNIMVGNIISIKVDASDPDGGALSYKWETNGGEFVGSVTLDSVLWSASTTVEVVSIRATVTDNIGDFVSKDILINVFQETGSVWIADTFNDVIVKLASNGTQLLRLTGFNRPKKIAIDVIDRSIWVADWGNNRLVKYDANGNFITQVENIDRPTDIAVHSNGNIWVTTMSDTAQVYEFSYLGKPLRFLKGFSEPQAVDINRLTGVIWIADTGNDRIIRLHGDVPSGYNLDSTAVYAEQFHVQFPKIPYPPYNNPEGLVVDQSNGNCWIADTGNGRVVRISADDLKEFVIEGFLNPRGIDVNILDGSCWIANTGDNEIIKISRDIFKLPNVLPSVYNIDNKAGFHSVVSGYTLPWSLSVNSFDNIIWFADDYRVVKLQDKNQIITILNELVNFNAPRSLVVNTGIK